MHAYGAGANCIGQNASRMTCRGWVFRRQVPTLIPGPQAISDCQSVRRSAESFETEPHPPGRTRLQVALRDARQSSREMANPNPIPRGFVVTKVSNMLS